MAVTALQTASPIPWWLDYFTRQYPGGELSKSFQWGNRKLGAAA